MATSANKDGSVPPPSFYALRTLNSSVLPFAVRFATVVFPVADRLQMGKHTMGAIHARDVLPNRNLAQ